MALGWVFTEKDEEDMRRAIASANEFMDRFCRGTAPAPRPSGIRDERAYAGTRRVSKGESSQREKPTLWVTCAEAASLAHMSLSSVSGKGRSGEFRRRACSDRHGRVAWEYALADINAWLEKDKERAATLDDKQTESM